LPITVEDQLSIHALLTRADDAASNRDVAGYLTLFSDDAVLDGDKGMHQGKAALQEIVGRVWDSEDAATRHLTLNVVLDVMDESPTVVLATSTLLIVSPGAPAVIASISAIAQQVEKIAGTWKIRRRTVKLLQPHVIPSGAPQGA
jgi:ketosteroid isomerase-like protein